MIQLDHTLLVSISTTTMVGNKDDGIDYNSSECEPHPLHAASSAGCRLLDKRCLLKSAVGSSHEYH